MDLEIVQHAAENADTDDVNVIIKEHFDMVDQLRKNKDTNLRTHRNKVKAKLQARSRKVRTVSYIKLLHNGGFGPSCKNVSHLYFYL